MNYNDIVNVSIKGNDYRIHFKSMSKGDAINIMNNSNLNEKSRLLQIFLIIYKKEWNNLLSKKQRKKIK